MSANRTTPNDLRDICNIAWRVFREADLGYEETILVGESYAVHEQVLSMIAFIGYGDLTLTRIARGCRVALLSHFQEWMGRTTDGLDTQQRLAAYTLVHELQRLLGYGPRFGKVGSWIFLGRFRRDHDELPLQSTMPPSKDDHEVDLWGHPEGKVVFVRGHYMDDRTFVVNGLLDSSAREAFRRLAKEVVPVA